MHCLANTNFTMLSKFSILDLEIQSKSKLWICNDTHVTDSTFILLGYIFLYREDF